MPATYASFRKLAWGTSRKTAAPKPELSTHTQISHRRTHSPPPPDNSDFPTPYLSPQDNIHPTLAQITEHDSSHTPASISSSRRTWIIVLYIYSVFRYIKFMISQDRFYLGEPHLGHYKAHDSESSNFPLSVPKNTPGYTPDGWYAVSRGRGIGIYVTW